MVKINQLELENVKRIKAVALRPSESGLTIIGGNNNQGKSSVLDAIAWALGGEKYRPSQAQREGSVLPPRLKLTLSNGLVVERGGKNGSLKVLDPSGRKAGQQILNEFVEQLALDLPRFLHASEKEKAEILLQVIGVGEQLFTLDRQATELYNQRHAIGQIADQKAKFAREMPDFPGVPEEPISAGDLIRQQQEILARNGENQRKRSMAAELQQEYNRQFGQIKVMETHLAEARAKLAQLTEDLETAQKSVQDLQDESTAELEENIRSIEETNRKVRANLDKEKALEDAAEYQKQYAGLTAQLETVREDRRKLLEGADLPLAGLSVDDGKLTYHGMNWDSLSGSDQLKVATAIVRAVNPKCGFVLLDKLEQMDLNTLWDFGAWLEAEGLQVIATRVSTGGECSIVIEDGVAVDPSLSGEDQQSLDAVYQERQRKNQTPPPWKGGSIA